MKASITASSIPRWRGFNLQGRFAALEPGFSGGAYEESDFALMAEWGFDFARLPLSYWAWGDRNDWSVIDESRLTEIDRGVELGRRFGIHVNLSLHRVPGYCVNDRWLEPMDLFAGTVAQREHALTSTARHWHALAERYRAIPSSDLSFGLLNEPPGMESEDPYVHVVRTLVAGIRAIDPDRLLFADGLDFGRTPVAGIAEFGLVQSTRGYLPMALSHSGASWVTDTELEDGHPPSWPLEDRWGTTWNRDRLRHELVDKYEPIVRAGVQVHVGECGAFNQTPHAVTLAWLEDCLSVWREADWGFALWQLRGPFGVLDSKRSDVRYEAYAGHELDRMMLELLRAY